MWRFVMNNIKWIFFDVGSTLIDETECYNHQIRDAIAGTDITFEQINEKRILFCKDKSKMYYIFVLIFIMTEI